MRIVTWPTVVENENELIQQFTAYPDVVVHVRKPAMSLHDSERFIASFTMAQRKQLVLHQHQEYSQQWGLNRIHYPVAQRNKLWVGQHMSSLEISTSTHSWTEFNRLSTVYCAGFISPVFSSISKPGYSGNEMLRQVSNRTNTHTALIALGGITPENINSIRHQYDDFAICGGIWMADDPLRAFQDYYYAFYGENPAIVYKQQ